MEVGDRAKEEEEAEPLAEVEVRTRDYNGGAQDGRGARRKNKKQWSRQAHGTRGASKRAQVAVRQEK